jgi:hypothetical protein
MTKTIAIAMEFANMQKIASEATIFEVLARTSARMNDDNPKLVFNFQSDRR